MVRNTVVWTATAVKQRRYILKYWAEKTKSTAYSKKLIALINKRVKIILKYPESWRLTSHAGSRLSPMGHFSIIYRISGEGIIITAFWDNRQDPGKLLEIIAV